MNVKLKTSLIITVTLIAGIVIGAMLNRAYLHTRVQRVFQKRVPNVFVQSYLETIKPDAEQQKLIKDILERNAQRLSEIRAKNREDLAASMESMIAELETVLTPEQMKRLEEVTPVGRPSFGWRFGEGELAYLTKELELTEDQAAQIQEILEKFRMRPDMKRMGTQEDMASNFRKFREERDQEIKKVLTEEQKMKYEDLLKTSDKIQKKSPRGYRE